MKVMAIILSILDGLLLAPFLFILRQIVAGGSTYSIAPLIILWAIWLLLVVRVPFLIIIRMPGRLRSCYQWAIVELKLKWLRVGVRGIVSDLHLIVVESLIVFVILALVIAIAIDIIRLNRLVLFMPLDVPKELADQGYTPEVAARQLSKKYQEMVDSGTTRGEGDKNATATYDPEQHIAFPNTNISIRSLAIFLREFVGMATNAVSGEFISKESEDGYSSRLDYSLRLWIDGNALPEFPEEGSIGLTERRNMSPEEKIEQLFQVGARQVAWEINPIEFTLNLYWEEEHREEKRKIVKRLVPHIRARYAGVHEETGRWARAVSLEGYLFKQEKKYDQAIEKSEQAIRLNPKESRAYLNWGDVLALQGVQLERGGSDGTSMFEEAVEKYRTAARYGNAVLAYYGWGTVLTHRGIQLARNDDCLAADKKRYEAIAKFEKATQYDPRFVAAYYVWGNAHAMTAACLTTEEGRKVRLKMAIQKYKQAIERDPDFVPAYFAWGHALTDMGEYEDAIMMYKKATELNPEYAPAYYYWGQVLAEQGSCNEAIKKYRKASELNPRFRMPNLLGGKCLRFEL